MVYRALITLVLLALISGCASGGKRPLKTNARTPMLMTDVYANSVGDAQKDVAKFIDQDLKEQKTFGYVKPYIPVIEGPVVRKVWVPDHKSEQDGSILIGGHWVYLMVQGPKWFIEGEQQETKVPIIVPGKPVEKEN